MDQESFHKLNVRPDNYDPARASATGPGPSKDTLLTRRHAKVVLQIMEYLLAKPAPSMARLEDRCVIALEIQGSFPAFEVCPATSDIAVPKYPRPRFDGGVQ